MTKKFYVKLMCPKTLEIVEQTVEATHGVAALKHVMMTACELLDLKDTKELQLLEMGRIM